MEVSSCISISELTTNNIGPQYYNNIPVYLFNESFNPKWNANPLIS